MKKGWKSVFQNLRAKRQADDLIESYSESRDLSRVIVHVDMDAFYAAVEEKDEPSLKVIM